MLPILSQHLGWVNQDINITNIIIKWMVSAIFVTRRRREFPAFLGRIRFSTFLPPNLDLVRSFADLRVCNEIWRSFSWYEVVSMVLEIMEQALLLGSRLCSKFCARNLSRSNCCSRRGKSFSVLASLIPLSQDPSRASELRTRMASLLRLFLRLISSASNSLNFIKVSSVADMFVDVKWWHRSQREYNP